MRRERGGDSGGDHRGGAGGYGGTLLANEEEVGKGTEDVGHGEGGGGAVRSRTDYILGTDRSLIRNVAVRDPRHNSDHYMVMGMLWGGTVRV